MSSNGTLKAIAGGVQPTKEDYDVYGSCVYRSRVTGKQYLFVNAKSAEYLQFELTWVDDALHTTLVRNFTGGSGGQVEGCVSDELNGWVLIGEEPFGLWRYGAEPDDDVSSEYLIASINDTMYADVEGVALIEGATANEGFILVSQQGVSAYNVYRRAAPHDFVETFTIYENAEKGIDQVTNTDGITAVGTSLGVDLPKGLIVVRKYHQPPQKAKPCILRSPCTYSCTAPGRSIVNTWLYTDDDANQLPLGGTSDEASFKLVSVEDVIPEQLLDELDPNWDPRATLTLRTKKL